MWSYNAVLSEFLDRLRFTTTVVNVEAQGTVFEWNKNDELRVFTNVELMHASIFTFSFFLNAKYGCIEQAEYFPRCGETATFAKFCGDWFFMAILYLKYSFHAWSYYYLVSLTKDLTTLSTILYFSPQVLFF